VSFEYKCQAKEGKQVCNSLTHRKSIEVGNSNQENCRAPSELVEKG
jgi:hypothetical protein